mmetsp:Transcript_4841/g.11845  ORF Transcript_4841/g.11845 Transcript_4841/m.11845 type:complete len:103 (+) Transcript_4841:922-1230(+)
MRMIASSVSKFLTHDERQSKRLGSSKSANQPQPEIGILNKVVFEPRLPGEAIAHVRHHTYNPVPGVTAAHYLWYATIFLVATGVVLLCCFWSTLLECCGLKD